MTSRALQQLQLQHPHIQVSIELVDTGSPSMDVIKGMACLDITNTALNQESGSGNKDFRIRRLGQEQEHNDGSGATNGAAAAVSTNWADLLSFLAQQQ